MNSRQGQVLSTELYSKPTHFLLELLQNADDCSYAPGVQPRVLLVLMRDALLHATNETGFTAADISSICSMAMCSKSRKVGVFTGEKGEHSQRSCPRPPAASARYLLNVLSTPSSTASADMHTLRQPLADQ
jgi:hypothetical protein